MKFNPKIVFLGTPQFAVPSLQKLYAEGFEILSVICQPDKPAGRGQKMSECPVKKLALELQLDLEQPVKLNKDTQLIEKLKSLSPDLMITAAYGQLISEEIISIPTWGIWNVHASLLPRWRGAAPINWCLLSGDQKTGITIMQTEKGLDTGPILNTVSLPINESDDSVSLTKKLSVLGAELLIETIKKNLHQGIEPLSQMQDKATYATKLTKEMGNVNFSKMSAHEIIFKIKGLAPWPGCFFEAKSGEKIKLLDAKVVECSNDNFQPGEITLIKGELFGVKCKENELLIDSVQPPNKNKMSAGSWLRGRNMKEGEEI